MRPPLEQAFEAAIEFLVRGLDHVLAQDPAAVGKLRPHAGQRIRLALDGSSVDAVQRRVPLGLPPPPELWLRIADDGLLETAAPDRAAPMVQMLLRPSLSAGADLLREGTPGLLRHLRIEGDAMLATTLGELVRTVRWDVEEDIARHLGDVPARRIGRAVEAAVAGARDFAARATDQARSFAGAEGVRLVGRSELASLRERVSALARRVDALTEARRGR